MKVLIIGGGVSGLATSIALARDGHSVTLAERDGEIHALGSGITLIGAALRAMHHLGVLEDALAEGIPIYDFEQRIPSGELVSSFTMPSPVGQEGGPGMMGMLRPDLCRILVQHATAAGVELRTGAEVSALETGDAASTATIGDGAPESYDLIVGADGLGSWTRSQLLGDVPLDLHEQEIYRVLLERPAELTQEIQFVGHPSVMAGFTPTGPDSMYMYVLVPATHGERAPESRWPEIIREHLQPFGGWIAEILPQLTDPSKINFTRFRTVVVPKPWRSGSAVLVGDAAHATTPHLAAGGAMCLEDAVVLAQEIKASPDDLGKALDAYTERRHARCEFVVNTSAQLSYWGVHPVASGEEVQTLIQQALETLAGEF